MTGERERLMLQGSEGLILPNEGIDLSHLSAQEDMPLRGGVELNYPIYRSRQDEATEIVKRNKDNVEATVRELGKKIHGSWDDYHGISYLHFPAATLDGLDIRGVAADYSVFTAGSLRHALMDRASLYAAVFAATDLEGASLVNVNARHLLAPFANFSRSNLRSIKAESAVLNFANFYEASLLGASLVGAYMIGVAGIEEDAAKLASSFEGAVVLGNTSEGAEETTERIEGHALSSRFTTQQMTTGTTEAKVYSRANWSRQLSSSSNIEGAILREIALGRADLTHLQAIGSIWDQVTADEVRMRAGYVSGATFFQTSLDGADTNRAWFPALVAIGSSFKGFRPGNIAGALFIDSDLSEMDTDLDLDAATGGAVIIGKEKHRPQIAEGNPMEEDVLQTTIKELPTYSQTIVSSLRRQRQLTTGARSKIDSKEIEQGQAQG